MRDGECYVSMRKVEEDEDDGDEPYSFGEWLALFSPKTQANYKTAVGAFQRYIYNVKQNNQTDILAPRYIVDKRNHYKDLEAFVVANKLADRPPKTQHLYRSAAQYFHWGPLANQIWKILSGGRMLSRGLPDLIIIKEDGRLQ